MKKTILLLLFVLFLIPNAYAIGLRFPPQQEVIFEPNKQVSLEYAASSSDPQPIAADVVVSAGDLQKYITQSEQLISIPAFGVTPFTVALTFPPELPPGRYLIKVEVSEHARISGMGGITGTADTFNVISPYPEGYPYAEILTSQYQKTDKPFDFSIRVQNIGKTPLQNQNVEVILMQGEQYLQKITIPMLFVDVFKKTQLKGTIDNKDITPGMYTIEADLEKNKILKEIAIGQPKIAISDIPIIKAGENNEFDITLTIDEWSGPIPDAYIQFGITNLLSIDKKMTLNPGKNTMHISAKANQGKSGTYPGRATVYGAFGNVRTTFQATAEGTTGSAGGFGFSKQEQDQPIGQAAKLENEPSAAKSNTFLMVLLMLSLLVFAFALGQYFARKGKNNGPQIPEP